MNMLLKPETYFAAREEVDRVIGKESVQAKHLKELHYIEAVLRETLRLSPTAPAFARGVRPENTEETVTIGKSRYEIPRGQPVLCLLGKIQRDPAVFGEDADEFKPERMLDGKFEDLPKNAWKVSARIFTALCTYEVLTMHIIAFWNRPQGLYWTRFCLAGSIDGDRHGTPEH
jgi:cytochrome P450/NADPH-cytochrome P450 reductase